MKHCYSAIAATLVLVCSLAACQSREPVPPPDNQSMSAAANSLVEYIWKPAAGEPIVFDGQKFFEDNRDEILETLEVADTLSVNDIGVALVRFSLGGDIYRSAVWMRQVDGAWLPRATQFFASYSDEYDLLSDDDQQRADEIIERVETWEEESKSAWWMW